MTAAQSNAEPAVSAPLGEDTAVSQNTDLNNRSDAMIPVEAKPDAALAAPEWSEEAKAKLRASRLGKHTMCIVGFAPTTRHLAPYDEPKIDERGGTIEIFGLNEAHRHKADYLKRWDRWAQIHEPWDYTKQNSAATKEHWEWLQQPHDFPIYMQEADPRIPASVTYPLTEIADVLLGKTKRIQDDGSDIAVRYFTSSFAYMAALVAYEKAAGIKDWHKIIVVGYEMATMTEYQYQKGSTEWWMGKLDGMGIEVIVPPKCRLLHGSLYGYEISRVFTRDMLVKLLDGERKKERDQIRKTATLSGRREAIEELLKETMEAMDKPLSEEHLMDLEVRNLELRPRARDAFQKEIESVRDINVQFGRSEELADLIAYTDNAKSQVLSGGEEAPVVNRQLLEFRLKSIHDAENQWIQKVLIRRGQRTAIQDLYKTAKAEQQAEYQQHGSKIFKKELDESSMANIIVGRREMTIELIRHLDNIDPDQKILQMLMQNDELRKEEGK